MTEVDHRGFFAIPSGGTPVEDTLFLSFSVATGSTVWTCCAELLSIHAKVKSDYSDSTILVEILTYLLINITVVFLTLYL